MKKFLSLLLTAIITLSLTACGGDEPDQPSEKVDPYTLIFDKLVTFTFNKSDNSVNYLGTAKYSLVDLQSDNNSQSVRVIQIADINFDQHMPFPVTFHIGTNFKSPEVAFSWNKTSEGFNAYGTIDVISPKMVDYDGNPTTSRYEISNFTGIVDEEKSVTSFTYDVSDQWHVVSINNTLSSVSHFDGKNLPSYQLVVDPVMNKAELFLYNIQFEIDGVKSPVLNKISVPGLDFVTDINGLKVTGNDITPNYYINGVATPYPSLTVTNFEMNVDIINAKFDLNFDCHGGNYNVKNVPLYLYK